MSDQQDTRKRHAAEEALTFVADGMTLGLGSGSTAACFVRALGARVAAGLDVRGIPTSRETEALAREVGVPLTTLAAVERIDVTVDGADEVDAGLNLIKGGGGALLREKVVASVSDLVVIVVDPSKLVPRLGAFPLPVEVTPFAVPVVARALAATGCTPVLRVSGDGAPVFTDNGNHILDCPYQAIDDAPALARRIRDIVGVVEHGLFIDMAGAVVIGGDEGAEVLTRRGV